MKFASETVDTADTEAATELFYRRGWTDGLPIVPPTAARVEAMLRAAELPPDEVLGTFAEADIVVTAEKVAINAVLAGCRPAYMRVVVAIIKAITNPDFGLMGVQATMGGTAILSIVGGPVAKELELNSGLNCFGPGPVSNGTIGRALRLIQLNVLGQRPGLFERSVFGRTEKYTFCVAEADEIAPWTPLYVQQGCREGSSGVTVFPAQSGMLVADSASESPEEMLLGVAHKLLACHISRYGHLSAVVVISPDAFQFLSSRGWDKDAVSHYLHVTAQKSLADLKQRPRLVRTEWVGGHEIGLPAQPGDECKYYPITPGPEAILLVVAGGLGIRQFVVIPSMAEFDVEFRPVTQQIEGESAL